MDFLFFKYIEKTLQIYKFLYVFYFNKKSKYSVNEIFKFIMKTYHFAPKKNTNLSTGVV